MTRQGGGATEEIEIAMYDDTAISSSPILHVCKSEEEYTTELRLTGEIIFATVPFGNPESSQALFATIATVTLKTTKNN